MGGKIEEREYYLACTYFAFSLGWLFPPQELKQRLVGSATISFLVQGVLDGGFTLFWEIGPYRHRSHPESHQTIFR